MYSRRGLIGLTGAGLLYTYLADGTAQVLDDGVMMAASERERNKWMVDFALENGATVGAAGFTTVEVSEFVDTGLRPNVTNSFWIGGLHKSFVKGSYEIRVTGAVGALGYKAEIRDVRLHWTGTDIVDPHPPWNAAEDANPVLRSAETLVWAVGTPLGADYPIHIHAFDDSPGLQTITSITNL